MYKALIRPILFLFPAEKVHRFTFGLLKWLFVIPGMKNLFQVLYRVNDKRLETNLFGLRFANPVGLAAGFDKDAELVEQMEAIGFGFVEIGTLTPMPQYGNDKPRLFRLKDDDGIINRMGFNNSGVEKAVKKLKETNRNIIVGGNIGKNKITENEDATNDYMKCFAALYDVVDYFVVNVSSPNTPNLRDLQEKEPLTRLLNTLQSANKAKPKPKPLLLKIAPDLTDDQLDDIIEIVKQTEIDGVIATNTTVGRDNLSTDWQKVNKIGAGGLSGQPLKDRATEVIRYIAEKSNHTITIIGVGGINCAEDAIEKLKAGASLVQVYTGFVYEGPALVKKINKGLLKEAL